MANIALKLSYWSNCGELRQKNAVLGHRMDSIFIYLPNFYKPKELEDMSKIVSPLSRGGYVAPTIDLIELEVESAIASPAPGLVGAEQWGSPDEEYGVF